ncbi:hypothetical protein [Kitasatospora sp. NPDC093806]|uniref:hypothetical protein n=1 Tax=Kitasatospora sp. NPDC093806 TaxID=3155075 RepID=UPI00341D1918
MTDRLPTPFDELGARIEQGDPLDRILLDRIDASWRDVLRNCSVVPDFTEELYRIVLAGTSGPSIAELLDHGLLERAAPPGRYRITDLLRFTCWDSWWQGSATPSSTAPVRLRNLAVTLARVYATAGDQPAWLRQLAITGELTPTGFRAAFDEADRRFDLAHCQDLVNAVTDPQIAPLLPRPLGRTVAEARVRVRSRALWRPAYHQSAGYFGRERAEEPLRALVERPTEAVVRLHATGGAGKSMLLRWFMARYCQDRAIPVPCAYLDLDRCDPVVAAGQPWLLLLEAAAQLNEQLPDAPFEELLAEHGECLSLLLGKRDRASGPALTVQRGRAVRRRFGAVLEESLQRRGTSAILVLDTLEELLLRDGAPLRELTAMLDELVEAPGVRIVLSGRYDLAEAVPVRARAVRLEPFGREEADAYLREVRAIADPELRRAITESSDGLPYTLALFADLAGDLTAEQIRSASGPGLLYAIDRVLERVHDDRIRWLLRYGVIPRRLTLRVVEDVMLPHLRSAIRGRSTDDDPSRDERPVVRFPIFLQADPGFTDDAAELPDLWAALTRYAGDALWVDRDPADPEALVLDPMVREPLRTLLADHPVSRLLHRDLAEHFARRAEEDQERWVEWRVEEFYHRFTADPEEGEEAWARLLGRPGPGTPEVRPALVVERVTVLELSGEVTLPPHARVRARLMICRSYLEIPEVQEELLADLGAARSLLDGAPDPELGCSVELAAAAVLIELGRLSEAKDSLDSAARNLDSVTTESVAEHHRLTGAVSLARGRVGEAQYAFEQADRLLRPGGGPPAPETLADVTRLLDAGFVGHAARWLPRLGTASAPELHLRLLLAVGRPSEALDAYAELARSRLSRPTDLAALAALRLHRPNHVLVLTDSPAAVPVARPGEARCLLVRAEALIRLRAPRAEVAQLVRLVEEADLPEPELIPLLARGARLLRAAGGRHSEAVDMMARVVRMTDPGPAEPATPTVPLPVLADLMWWPDVPSWVMSHVLNAWRASAPPPNRVLWLLGGLAFADPAEDEALTGEMIDALGPLGLPQARLVALERLRELTRPLQVSLETAARLTDLCTPDLEWTESPDAAALGLTYAELLRLLGRTWQARDLVRSCIAVLTRTEGAAWLLHLDRPAPTHRPGEPLPPRLADELARQYARVPEAAAAVLVEQAVAAFWEGWDEEGWTLSVRARSLVELRPTSLTKARAMAVAAMAESRTGRGPDEAGTLLRYARELYRELGVEPESWLLPTTGSAVVVAPGGLWREHVLTFSGGTRFPPVRARFRVRLPDGSERAKVVPRRVADWFRTVDALQTVLSASDAEWVAEVGPVLAVVPGDSTDLRVESSADHRVLAAAPLEAALATDGKLALGPERRHVYRGLSERQGEAVGLGRLQSLRDHHPGDSRATDLRSFVEDLWLGAPAPVRVAVLARNRSAGDSEHTGGRSSMPHVLPLYQVSRAAHLVDPTRGDAARATRGPQLIHLQGEFRESSGRIRAQWDARGASDAAGLGEYLGRRRGPNPVLVLEATHPGSHHEAVRQLLLRNLFAAEVLARGDFSAVLAIGPFLRPGAESERARRKFVEQLLTGTRPADAVQELTRALLRHPGPPTIALPALFSVLPPDLLAPLWTDL